MSELFGREPSEEEELRVGSRIIGGANFDPGPDSGSEAVPVQDQWPEPTPLTGLGALPEFPVNLLTPWLGDFSSGLATETQTPLGLCAPMVLAVAASAVQRNVGVRVRAGWSEPTNVFMVSALESGGRKSAVFTRATRPLEQRERDLAKGMREKIAAAENEIAIMKKALARRQEEAAKAEPSDRARLVEESKALAIELAGKSVPKAPRLVASDVTAERLGALLAENGGRMGAFSDEGTLFKVVGGLYNDRGGNLDPLLKAHAGTTIRYDRQGQTGFVESPALTIGMLVQPKIIVDMAANPQFRGEGFLARIAFSVPRSTVGERDENAPAMDEGTSRDYDRNMEKLLSIEPAEDDRGRPAAHVLHVGRDALDALLEFMRRIEPHRGQHGTLGHISDWACKADGLVVRIAAILHLCDHANDYEPWVASTSGSVMDRAIGIVEGYFLPHSLAAFNLMGASPATALANRAVGVIVRQGWREPFTRKVICDALKVEVADWSKAHAVLAEKVLVQDLPTKKTGGRPRGPYYLANPGLFDAAWAQELAR